MEAKLLFSQSQTWCNIHAKQILQILTTVIDTQYWLLLFKLYFIVIRALKMESTPLRNLIVQCSTIPHRNTQNSTGKDMEKLGPCTLLVKQKMAQPLWKTV